MLQVTIPESEFYDEANKIFVYSNIITLQLEHSLVSLSKWESKWKVPFLGKKERSAEEMLDYIRCMTITQNVGSLVYENIPNEVIAEIGDYINDPMTATTFSKSEKQVTKTEIITAEIIYHWMIFYNVPFECQKWHLNRLLALINVCSIKAEKPKKIAPKDAIAERKALNAARRAKYNSRG